jgi:hypothetical protein
MPGIENERRRDFLKASAIIGGGFALGLNLFDSIGVARAASATSVYKLYAKDVYENLKYRPTWLPGSPVELGAVGVIEEGIFRPITDLKALDIPFAEKVDSDRDAIDCASKNGVSISFKAAGETNGKFEAIAKADAGVLIEFSREGAVVLQLRDVSLNRIADQSALSRALLRSMAVGDETKQWQRNWVVITEVARAGRATIVISSSGNSRLELKASGSTAPASLVDASAALSVATESEISTKVIAESGLTPLYRGFRVRHGFFWLYDEVLPATAEPPPADAVFGEADPAEDDGY